MPPNVHTPHTFGHPHMFREFLIGYLFCYIIKCFPTLEAVMGVITLRGVHAPLCSYAPVCLDASNVWGLQTNGGVQTYGDIQT